MKKLFVLPLVLFLSGQVQAASVKAQMSSQATESQAQQAKESAEQASGQRAEIVRDESGKVESVVLTLPEHDNTGIERAREALLQNEGVATVATIVSGPSYDEATLHLVSILEGGIMGYYYSPEQLEAVKKGMQQLSPEARIGLDTYFTDAASAGTFFQLLWVRMYAEKLFTIGFLLDAGDSAGAQLIIDELEAIF